MNMPFRQKILLALSIAAFCLALGGFLFGRMPERISKAFLRQPQALTVQGQVTYVSREDNLFYLQGPTGGYRVDAARIPEGLEAGSSVEVSASGTREPGNHTLKALALDFIEPAAKPSPMQLDEAGVRRELAKLPTQGSRLVEVTGIVRDAQAGMNGLALRLRLDNSDLEVRVRILTPGSMQSESIALAAVRVSGVLEGETGVDGKSIRPVLLTQKRNQVKIEMPPRPEQSYPIVTVDSIAGKNGTGTRERVRLRGFVTRQDTRDFRLNDRTGSIRLASSEGEYPEGRQMDAWGYVTSRNGVLELEDSVLKDTEAGANPDERAKAVPARLDTVKAIHLLPRALAASHLPIQLRGVVTYIYPNDTAFFVQDATGGIYIRSSAPLPQGLHEGQRVAVRGVTGEGAFAPVIAAADLAIEGTQSLPDATAVDWNELLSGRQDSNWVELEGVIHSLGTEENQAYATAVQGTNWFRIYVPRKEDLSSSLIDAKVRVRGVCATIFDSRREIRGVKIMAPGPAYVRVETAALPEKEIAVRKILDLERFSTEIEPGHRSRVQAVVTNVQRGGRLFLRDETSAVRADCTEACQFSPGEQVDVVGFLRQDEAGPLLENASATLLKRHLDVKPIAVSANEVKEENYEAQLIELRAAVSDHVQTQGSDLLTLESGQMRFGAVLEEGLIPGAKPGSFVRLRGVAEVHPSRRGIKMPFTLYLRSPQDVTVLEGPAWHLSSTFGWALLAIGSVAALVSFWALVLHRQVRRQTEVIRKQLQDAEQLRGEAETASRAKGDFLANMSHEIRTPLNGVLGMTELALMEPLSVHVREYLEVAKQSGYGLLQVINDVLDVSKIEAGKMTIEIAPLNLLEILEQALSVFKPAAGQKAIRLELDYPVQTPCLFQGDAVRIRQIVLNLLGNAMKFTERGQVMVRVRCKVLDEQRRTVRIEVEDTGIGIPLEKQAQLFQTFEQVDTSTTRKYGGTGLGLSISKKLAGLMGGFIDFSSIAGEGSLFALEIALVLTPQSSVPREDGAGSREANLLHPGAASLQDNWYRAS